MPFADVFNELWKRRKFMDEPTSGLDEAAAETICQLIAGLKKDHIVVVSTHDSRFRAVAEHLIEL